MGPTSPPRDLSFGAVIKLGLGLIQLDERSMDHARGPSTPFWSALAIPAVAGALGGLAGGPVGLAMSAGMTLFGLAVTVGISHLLARLAGGRAPFEVLLKVFSVGYLIHWAAILPPIRLITTVWYFVMSVAILRRVHGLSTPIAVLIMLLPTLLMFGATLLLFLGLLFEGFSTNGHW